MISYRSNFLILQFLNRFREFFWGDVYLAQDFSDEGTRQIPSRVFGQSRGPSIRVSIKNVAAFLSDSHKTHLEKYFLHDPKIHYRQMSHMAISICCKPTKWGKSGRSSPYSSRHSSITSFKFSCSSSKVSAWVWAPGRPGTLPT